MITGDDILIEYVSRLVKTLACLQEDLMNHIQIDRMEKFISHYVWHLPDLKDSQTNNSDAPVQARLNNRLSEMTDRRRRLIKYMFKKENKLDQFES